MLEVLLRHSFHRHHVSISQHYLGFLGLRVVTKRTYRSEDPSLCVTPTLHPEVCRWYLPCAIIWTPWACPSKNLQKRTRLTVPPHCELRELCNMPKRQVTCLGYRVLGFEKPYITRSDSSSEVCLSHASHLNPKTRTLSL